MMLKITNCEDLHYVIICSFLLLPLSQLQIISTPYSDIPSIYVYIFKMSLTFKLNLNSKKKDRSSNSIVQFNEVFRGGRKSQQEIFAFCELIINSENTYTLWYLFN
jgi:hypothetical protein